MEQKDIFDKLMHLPVLRIFEPFYKKNKEVLLYLFFGGLTFFINLIAFAVIHEGLGVNEHISNVIAWVVAVFFAYFTNRIWVFQAQTSGTGAFLKQMMSFLSGRVFTLLVEEAILLVFITWLHCPSMIVKTVAQVVVIVLNYLISKILVFRKK